MKYGNKILLDKTAGGQFLVISCIKVLVETSLHRLIFCRLLTTADQNGFASVDTLALLHQGCEHV